MQQYIDLLKDIKENGVRKPSRAGDTLSVFGRMFRWNMDDGFPLMTIKKVSYYNIIHELLWFLGAFDEEWQKFGNTNIRYLVDHNVNIWNDDAYRGYVTYMERAKHGAYLSKEDFVKEIKNNDDFALRFGELGRSYGAQWRSYGCDKKLENLIGEAYKTGTDHGIDQIQQVIDRLKSSPLSRRHIVTAWNPEVIDELTLPPCHYGFTLNAQPLSVQERMDLESFYIRTAHDETDENVEEILDNNGIPKYRLSLLWNQRSVDSPLGFPYNLASYGFLLKTISHFTNMIPGNLIGSLEDTHYYTNQQDAVDKIIDREGILPELPTVELINMEKVNSINDLRIDNFKVKNYNPLSTVKAPLSVGL